jgi:rhodanese-related sulfurtransferase
MALDDQPLPEIDVDELDAAIGRGDHVVDVREDDEWRDGHVPGARHIALGTVTDRVGEFPSGVPVYVVCHAGGRSARAAAWLRTQGIDAVNVAGGTAAWLASGRAAVVGDEPGSPATS